MKNKDFSPYLNEADCLQIGDLTIENRLDRVSIYGSVDLTKDKQGLEHARDLKRVIDSTLIELENSNLPDLIAVAEPKTVKNPFT